MAAAALREGLESLARDAQDLWVPAQVPRVDSPISALEFLREYVATNTPVILGPGSGLLDHWPAVYRWQNWEYVKALVGTETLVTVNATPNGRGDAILDVERSGYPLVAVADADEAAPPGALPALVFVKPEARRMPFGAFIDRLVEEEEEEQPPSLSGEVLYLSQQDDSLRKEFPMLCRPAGAHARGSRTTDHEPAVYVDTGLDIESDGFPMAREAFGNEPDAVNLWIGDHRAVSSFHRDPYENMYAVLVGEKHFTLLPPCDAWALPEATALPQAHFRTRSNPSPSPGPGPSPSPSPTDAGFEVVLEPGAEPITWIDLEAEGKDRQGWRPQHAPQRGRWPWQGAIHPLECRVKAGEVLFLPSLWYHRVTQTCPTIAVNFWHDMPYGCRFVYWQFVVKAGKALRHQLEEEGEKEEEEEAAPPPQAHPTNKST